MILRSGLLTILILVVLVRFLSVIDDPWPSEDEIHRIVGSPANHVPSGDPGSDLKVVSWNIQRGTKFEAVVDTLGEIDPDVILLQEVDRFCLRTGGRDVAHDLAVALRMNWLSAGEFQELGESRGGIPALTGQAMLSKYPMTAPRVIVFEHQARLRWRLNPIEPRRGGRIALGARVNGVLVYNVHLESGGNELLRRAQLDEVLVEADRERAPHVVVAGDFNNVAPDRSPMLQALASRSFTSALGPDNHETHIRHRYPIDWIFTKGMLVMSGSVARVERVSDHYPVVARLRLLN